MKHEETIVNLYHVQQTYSLIDQIIHYFFNFPILFLVLSFSANQSCDKIYLHNKLQTLETQVEEAFRTFLNICKRQFSTSLGICRNISSQNIYSKWNKVKMDDQAHLLKSGQPAGDSSNVPHYFHINTMAKQ